jgi:hypothetical protein
MLAGVYFDKASRHQIPEGVEEYHALVRQSIESIPYVIGDWVGIDTEIKQEALKILDANVSLSRSYRNIKTGRTATLLLVHSGDSRSLLGHYPPVCYPSQGWTQLTAAPHSIPATPAAIQTTEYSFAYEALGQSAQIGVFHFTVLPDGRTAPDMQLLEVSARNNRAKYLGGASIQFIVDANLSLDERAEVSENLAKALSDWLLVVESGLDAVEPGKNGDRAI